MSPLDQACAGPTLSGRTVGARSNGRRCGRICRMLVAKRSDVLSPCMVRIIEDLAGDWHRLDERIAGVTFDIEALAAQDPACKRLMPVPGIGPIISSAMVPAIGNGEGFSKGRGFGGWLGLVPREMSTGDRTILGKISKQGNRYLRVLFVQAAWAVILQQELGSLRAQAVDRSRQEAAASQCAGDCARQQAGPHGLGGSQQGAIHPSRREPWHRARFRQGVACRRRHREEPSATASLDGTCARRPANHRPGRRNGYKARTKETGAAP
jgi:Transposase IS116/IS110/IS902 family